MSFKQYNIYKPNKNGNGNAIQIELSEKPNKKNDKFIDRYIFLSAANQKGVDSNGNASFDWGNKTVIKLEEVDLGSILGVLSNRQPEVTLFHQVNQNENKIIKLNKGDHGIFLNISHKKDSDTKSYKISLNVSEICILYSLLNQAIIKLVGWD